MSIVERMAAAADNADECGYSAPSLLNYQNMIRAALRAIKPEDVSEAMCDAACDEVWGVPPDVDHVRARYRDRFRRAIAAAIAAGADQ